MANVQMKQLVAVINRGEGDKKKGYWTRIGVAFQNHDASWNLRFDFVPTDPDTTIQMRSMERERGSTETK